jgi:NAD(P)H-dependent flavin oxidoreductase YrpB (nitropropane dioxygenase family)
VTTPLCHRVGVDLPVFAFSHCRDVVAAVSRAGGLGVLGASGSRARHVKHQLAADVDVIVAQDYEAAGHTGHVTTTVLVPQVVHAAGAVPVVAAGGIATGIAGAATAGPRLDRQCLRARRHAGDGVGRGVRR